MGFIGRWGSILKGYYKQAWHEIPVVTASAHFAAGALLIGHPVKAYWNHLNVNKNRYKIEYFIVRPDDPRLAGTLRTDTSPIVTKYEGPYQ